MYYVAICHGILLIFQGTFSHVPKERLGFKLRGGIDKQVTITVTQVTNSSKTESEDPQVREYTISLPLRTPGLHVIILYISSFEANEIIQ